MPEILDQDRDQELAKYSFVGKVPRLPQPDKEAEPKGTPDAGEREFLPGGAREGASLASIRVFLEVPAEPSRT